jgi:hypothetical protein
MTDTFTYLHVFTPTPTFQPRRLIVAPAADGCKCLLDRTLSTRGSSDSA